MKDWIVEKIHVCNVRLRLLQELLKDVGQLQTKKSAELRELGRLPYPMIRRRSEKGFNRVSWDEALKVIAGKIKATTSDRLSFYITRGLFFSIEAPR